MDALIAQEKVFILHPIGIWLPVKCRPILQLQKCCHFETLQK